MYGITSYKRNSYDPWREFRAWQRSLLGEEGQSAIKTDIRDTGEAYIVEAELPGYTKDEIAIDVKDDILTITAEKHNEETEEKKGYIRCERYSGSVSRSFNISEVDAAAISAKHENGVLTLTLPKKKEEIPQSRKISIE